MFDIPPPRLYSRQGDGRAPRAPVLYCGGAGGECARMGDGRAGAGATMTGPERIPAIDVGAGTQDILLWESGRAYENCVQLILPSQTQIVAARIRRATAGGDALFLTGRVMGGGASTDAVVAHLAAGWPCTPRRLRRGPSTTPAARCRPRRVEALGVRIVERQPP